MTIADIIGACEIYQYKFGSEEDFSFQEKYPRVSRWLRLVIDD